VIVLSSTFIFTGVDIVARSLLRRDLDFKRAAWVQALQNLTYSAASLILAALGLGYWSLVLASVLGQLVRTASAVAWRPHRIAWPNDLASIKSELWFGTHVAVSRFALYIRRFSDILVVGRVLGTEALGAYNVGWSQANIPVDRVGPVVTGVSAPVLAAAQANKSELRRYLRLFTEGLAFMTFPTTLGLAVVADDFVMLVFGERWVATIGPLRVLAVVAAMRAITPVLSQVLIATDQTKKNMQFTVAGAIMIPAFLLVGTRWGITGVALGWLVGHPLAMGTVLLRHALRAAEMPFREYLAALAPAGISSLVMIACVLALRLLMPADWPLAGRFATEVAGGALAYGLVVLVMYRGRIPSLMRTFREMRNAKQGIDSHPMPYSDAD
jgi:PST family polysaccharide transporter